MKSLSTIIPRLAAAAFLLTIFAPSAPAQSDNSDYEREGCQGAAGLERIRCKSKIVAPEGVLFIPGASQRASRFGEPRLSIAQIGKDLDYLQAVPGQLSQLASQSELNFKSIAQSASEIRSRAARLKESLALPNPKEPAERTEEEGRLNPAQLRAALSTLSALISEAVRNPILRGYVLDLPRAAQARSSLEEIIALSKRIRTSSEPRGKGRR